MYEKLFTSVLTSMVTSQQIMVKCLTRQVNFCIRSHVYRARDL